MATDIESTGDDAETFAVRRPRTKNLEAQRAFRARKAAHVAELEREVALLRSQVLQLRLENAGLRAAATATATGSAVQRHDFDGLPSEADNAMQTESQRCCAAGILCELGQQQRLRPSVLRRIPSQSCMEPLPEPLSRAESETADRSFAYQAPVAAPPMMAKPRLAKSGNSKMDTLYANTERTLRTLSTQHNSNIVHDLARSDLRPVDAEYQCDEAPSPVDPNSQSPPQFSNSQIPVIKCCNDMFPCEDDAEARWMAVNTGKRSIGTNSVDDFYSLFVGPEF